MGHYNSFVVRIWSDGEGRLRGSIKHVPTRENLAFIDPEAIMPFIRSHLGPPVDQPHDLSQYPLEHRDVT